MSSEQLPNENLVPDEVVARKIYFLRGIKVMLDRDLAEMYGVETKRLKEQVRRNIERFPPDFMFEMDKDEFENWRNQNASSNSEFMGLRHAPFAFSEHGVLMLSSVLNTPRAIAVNIRIMRIFTKLKEIVLSNAEMLYRMERFERDLENQGKSIEALLEMLDQYLEKTNEPRRLIGFGR
jgi:ORF6N domain